MPKSKNSVSRKYLKILGIIQLVLAAIVLISGIFLMFYKWEIGDALKNEALDSVMKITTDENGIRALVGGSVVGLSLFQLLQGWLLVRAANDPRKSTFLLVLVVLGCISGIATLFTNGFSDQSAVFGNVIGLAINVLSFMAVMKARSEVDM